MASKNRKPLTLDDVRRISRAYQEYNRQRLAAPPPPPDQARIAALTGNDCGPPVFDLVAIWRAALADDACPDTIGRRRYMSPRRFVNGWAHLVGARDESGGRILVDDTAAFAYCQRLDSRVMVATVWAFIRRQEAAIEEDPIGVAVDATRGGPFALMMVEHAAARAAGLTVEGLHDAMMRRAGEAAADLDDFAAESLLSRVRRAIEGSPPIVAG